jgi:cell division transport system permease protein
MSSREPPSRPGGQVEWDYDLVIWLAAAASDSQLGDIAGAVAEAVEIADSTFFDHDATFAEFQQIFADEPELLEAAAAEDLSPSWRVRLVDWGNRDVAQLLEFRFAEMPGVQSVVTASEAVSVAC